MATSYGGTPPGITGTHFGGSRLGTPSAQVPSAGLNGPGYLYAGLSLPADAAVEVRGPITRWPAGTLTVYEDSSFSYVGASDFALYQLYQDGVASTVDIGYGPGIGRIELSVGATATLSGNASLGAITASGGLSGGTASSLGGTAALGAITASGVLAGGVLSVLGGTASLGGIGASGGMSGTGTADLSAPPLARRLQTRRRPANTQSRNR